MFDLWLVGCFLTASVVHFLAMRNTLANLWHPLAGIQILDLGEKHFLFRFSHRLDFERVIKGAPWMFNKHLLVVHRLVENEDPMQVSLIYSFFWVQIHDLSSGYFSENVAKQLGNFIGSFEKYDTK